MLTIPVLYVIGVGPGDPELLTLKAVRILRDVPLIFVPKGRQEGKSIALSIVSDVMDINNKEIMELHFPMKKTKYMTEEEKKRWHALSEEIIKALKRGRSGAFLTLGDPSLYSTFFYLYERLLSLWPELKIEIVPGISSINAGAGRAGIPLALADERIAIIPANYLFKDTLDLGESISTFHTIVFLKVDTVFEELKSFLLHRNLIDSSIYIARLGMENEKIIYDLRSVKQEDLDYFSMIIVRLNQEEGVI